MKINELFIGAWVMDGIKPAEVTGITCDGIVETTVNESSNIEVIYPIPLTPEILERLGFEWRAYAVCLSGEDICLVQCGDYWRAKPHQMSNDTICRIQYVHQLQCLLNLCDIDLEITFDAF